MKICITPLLDNGKPNAKDVIFERIRKDGPDVVRITIHDSSGAAREIDLKSEEVETMCTALGVDGFGVD